MYLVLKLKEYLIVKIDNIGRFIWLVPLFISILSIWVMHHPLFYEGMRIDLRGIPLLFISYLGGWMLGILSIILPTIYRLALSGPTVIQGIVIAIFIPVIVGSLFHRRKSFAPPYTILNIKHMMKGFFVYEIIKTILMFLTTPVTVVTVFYMLIFEMIAFLTIGIITNETNRSLLFKKELEFQARHDNMTNLYNLRYFKSKVDILITKKKPFVIAMFDIDFFKNYNDNHGHPAGDSVLRTIGQLLQDSMREEDVFARYGGEEFIICLSNITSSKTAEEIADRFRNLVETYPFHGEELQPNGKLTISMGVSSLSESKSLDHLISEADKSLYHSKKTGKNIVSVYHG